MWPVLARHLLLPAHEALLRRPTLAILGRLGQDDGADEQAVARWQAGRFERLARHAVEATPYWRERARRERFEPSETGCPVLTRAEIALHREAMRWPDAPCRLFRDTSSGTTDDPVVFYVDRERQAWDRALRLRALARLGIDPGERQLHVWPEYTGGRFGRLKAGLRAARDRLTNDPVFDLQPMTPARLDAALDFLDRWRPAVLFGYPSWLHALARRRLARGGGWRPRLVVTTAEPLYDFQRRAIGSAFGAPLAEEYGSQGVGLIASEDAAGRWRVHWEHVRVEIVGADGRPAGPGEMGEVVVTNLDSHAMPFIRFATGDAARAPAGGGDAVRTTLPPIAGRTGDLLVDEGGRLLDSRPIVDAIVAESGATGFGLHQPAPGRLVVIEAGGADGALPHDRVEGLLRSALGAPLEVAWRSGAFRPAASGKRRYVCSPVAQARFGRDAAPSLALARSWPERMFRAA